MLKFLREAKQLHKANDLEGLHVLKKKMKELNKKKSREAANYNPLSLALPSYVEPSTSPNGMSTKH